MQLYYDSIKKYLERPECSTNIQSEIDRYVPQIILPLHATLKAEVQI